MVLGGDEVIRLARNASYFDAPPLIDSFHYRVLPDPLAEPAASRITR